ncbi:MAG TPA: DNA-formamidopyrimidine glycosylase [Anaerolineales bacterium]|nr:DNA-formamidopyrimidine glycosylase [Anaerolineales bacterium]
MPELPEVETIASNLRHGFEGQPSLLGREIIGSHLFWERTLAQPAPDDFSRRIKGQRIESIGRRGKFLVFHLSLEYLLVHLRMSGDLWVEKTNTPIGAHYRLILNLAGAIRMVFNDTRKFGRVWLTADPDSILGGLGPEPLAENFTARLLFDELQSRRRQLKPLLLDQSFIAGLGNIYTDEALNLARLHPLDVSHSLTYEQAERLWKSIQTVLQAGILRNGTSIDWVYRGGDYQNYLRVYGRAGKPCPECGAIIERMSVGQRSTHYCPRCQVSPGYQD